VEFRQLCEIDCKVSRPLDQEAGVSCDVRVTPAVENGQLSAGGIIDSESVRNLDKFARVSECGWSLQRPPRLRGFAICVRLLLKIRQ